MSGQLTHMHLKKKKMCLLHNVVGVTHLILVSSVVKQVLVFELGSLVSVGVSWRYFSTVAVQVSMCCSPAVVTGLGETDTSGGWRAVDNES